MWAWANTGDHPASCFKDRRPCCPFHPTLDPSSITPLQFSSGLFFFLSVAFAFLLSPLHLFLRPLLFLFLVLLWFLPYLLLCILFSFLLFPFSYGLFLFSFLLFSISSGLLFCLSLLFLFSSGLLVLSPTLTPLGFSFLHWPFPLFAFPLP